MKKAICTILSVVIIAGFFPDCINVHATNSFLWDCEPTGGVDFVQGKDITSEWIVNNTSLVDAEYSITHEKEFAQSGDEHFWRFTFNSPGDANNGKYVRLRKQFATDLSIADVGVLSFKFRHNGEIDSANPDMHVAKRLELVDNSGRLDYVINIDGDSINTYDNRDAVESIACSQNEWHLVEIVMNGEKDERFAFVDGTPLSEEPVKQFYYADNNKFADSIRYLQFHVSFFGEIQDDVLDLDDIKFEPYNKMQVEETFPQNGDESAELGNTIKVQFDRNIHDISGAKLTVNGEVVEEALCEKDATDNKIVSFTLPQNFEENTEYLVKVEGITDNKCVEMEPYEFAFNTKTRILNIKDPQISTSGTNTTCSVEVENEKNSPESLAVIFAHFNGNKMTDIAFEQTTLQGGQDHTFTPVLSNAAGGEFRVFMWKTFGGMEPIKVSETVTAPTVSAVLDYATGIGEIKGNYTGKKVSMLILYPGCTIDEITPENVKSKVAFVGEAECAGNGEYSQEFELIANANYNGETFNVLSGGAGVAEPVKTPLKYYSKQTIENVFGIIQNSTPAQLVSMIDPETTELIDGVHLNDVLNLTLTDYLLLENKEAVWKDIAGVSFTKTEDIWNLFYENIETQKQAEVGIKSAVSDINEASWDKMSELLNRNRILLNLNLDGNYKKLSVAERISLYKILASDYVYKTGKDVDDAIQKECELLIGTSPDSSGDIPDEENSLIWDCEPKEGETFVPGYDVTPQWTIKNEPGFVDAEYGITHETEIAGDGDEHFWRFTFDSPSSNNNNKFVRLRKQFEKDVDFSKAGVLSFRFRHNGKIDSNSPDSHVAKRLELVDDAGRLDYAITIDGDKIYTYNNRTAENSYYCEPEVWHNLEIFLDGTENVRFALLDGVPLSENPVKHYFDETSSANKFGDIIRSIQFHFTFYGEIENDLLDIDNIKFVPYEKISVKKSYPEKGDVKAEIGNIIQIQTDREVFSTEGAKLTVDGTVIENVLCQLSPDNKKMVTFTLPQALSADTEYTVTVEGLEDDRKIKMESYEFSFKTRPLMLNPKEPHITTSGTNTTCSVEVVNETNSPESLAVIFAHFNGNKMMDITFEEYLLGGGQSHTFTPVLSNAVGGEFRVFMWKTFKGMEPIKVSETVATPTVSAVLDYATGIGKISGNYTGEKASMLVLYPDCTIDEITPANVKTKVAFVGEAECTGNGVYSQEFEIATDASTYNGESFTVLTGGAGVAESVKTPLKYYSKQTIENVFAIIQNSTPAQLVSMIDPETTELINGVHLNTLLNLDLTDYLSLQNKEAAWKDIAGVSFTKTENIWNLFYERTQQQKQYEADVKIALAEINDAVWDEMEEVLIRYAALLQLNLNGEYKTLSRDQKISLYKILAKDYVYKTAKEVDDAIQKESKLILEGKDKVTTSSGASGGGNGGGDTKKHEYTLPVEPVKNEDNKAVTFSDIAGVPWAENAINYLFEKGVVSGVGENLFKPNDLLTREQMVKILVLANGCSLVNEGEGFKDVKSSDWYYTYVLTAQKEGIVSGIGNGTFGSGRNVTRQDLAVFMWRIAEKMGILTSTEEGKLYEDDAEISDYAKKAVYAMNNLGIMNGVGNGYFAPNENVTRAMAAKAVYELLTYNN